MEPTTDLMDFVSIPPQRRFPFGDKPHQTIPDEWIEPFLRYIYANNVNLFGKAVLAAMGAQSTDGRTFRGRSNG